MLDLHVSLMLSVAVIFLLMIMLLNSWLYKPMISFMEDRDETIKKDLEEANQATDNVSELKAEAANILAEAKSEAAAMRQKAVDEAKTLAESKIEGKNDEIAKAYEAFKAELEEERVQLKNSLTSQLPLFKEALKAKYSQI